MNRSIARLIIILLAVAVVVGVVIGIVSGSNNSQGDGKPTGTTPSNSGSTTTTTTTTTSTTLPPDLHSPEIIGEYTDGKSTVLAIEACEKDGTITATYEQIVNNGYCKIKLQGKVISKNSDGSISLEWTNQSIITSIDTDDIVLPSAFTVTENGKYLKFDNTELASGTKAENLIGTAEDLQKLAESNETFVLINDVNLDGIEWKPIENFSGKLIGNGHSISNLTIDASSDNVGFFSVLKGTVIDVKFENASVTVTNAQENIGILCGLLENAKVEDIYVSGTISAEKSKNVGGIIGKYSANYTFEVHGLQSEANITGNEYVGGIFGYMNCSMGGYSNPTVTLTQFKNSGKVTATGSYVGGAIGYGMVNNSNSNHVFTFYASDFENTGDVTGKSYVGGLFGYAYSDGTASYIQDSSSSANIKAEAMVGGLAGQLEYIQMNNCDNAGTTITATKYIIDGSNKYAYVGGYAGRGYIASNCTNTVDINYTAGGLYVGGIMGYSQGSDSYEMIELKNTATINGENYVGGIFGYSSANWTFSASNFENKGDIVGNEYVGGIFGYMNCSMGGYSNPTVTLTQFKNSGKVTATGSYVGGAIGYGMVNNSNSNHVFTFYASDFENTGDVTGKSYVGGLIGFAYSDDTNSCIRDSKSSANITAEFYIGGLAGMLQNIQMDSCENTGSTVTATGYTEYKDSKCVFLGGFVGRAYIINNCTNTIDINYEGDANYVGGIAGHLYMWHSFSLKNLKNEGTVEGYNYVGGIFGYFQCYMDSWTAASTVTIEGFENSGIVKGNCYVGGSIGWFHADAYGKTFTLYASEFDHTGEVWGGLYVGGWLGYGYTDSSSSIISDSQATGVVQGTKWCGKYVGLVENIQIDYIEQ